jgi:hypothetical protein
MGKFLLIWLVIFMFFSDSRQNKRINDDLNKTKGEEKWLN